MAIWFYPGQEDYITKLNDLAAIAELIAGPKGWTPELAIVSDGERRVLQIVDWFDGEGTKPATGEYVGSAGMVTDIALAVDIRGPQGIQGIQGIQGGQGEQGIQGIQGIQGGKGDTGDVGPANTLAIGTVTSGVSAEATITGTAPTQTLNLVLPQGPQGVPGVDGSDGAAATIAVGTITTGAPGSSASVTNVGTSSAAVFNFSIPRGADGAGSGDVIGPASSTTNNVALFADASGKLLKDGGALGTAAFSASTSFATAVQGSLADSAVQPGDLATVATTGSYNDLSSKPTIPAAQVNTDWNATSGVAQILNKPAVIAAGATQADARAAIGAGTSNLALGTTAGTALAGNTFILPDAPSDSVLRGRKNGAWEPIPISTGDVTLAGVQTLTNKTIHGNANTITVDGTNEVGFRHIPQNSQSAAYTLVLADAGKHIFHPAADTTARIFTIPANSVVAFPIGTAVTFINQNGTGGVVTIAITTDTMRLAGAGTTGSRTLARNGVATAVKVTATEWIISGTGLT